MIAVTIEGSVNGLSWEAISARVAHPLSASLFGVELVSYFAEPDGVIRPHLTAWFYSDDPTPWVWVDLAAPGGGARRDVEQPTDRDNDADAVPGGLRRAMAEVRASPGTWLAFALGYDFDLERQVEHLTEFVAGDHVEAFLAYATEGDEANFKELATCLGVPADKLDEMYQVHGGQHAAPACEAGSRGWGREMH